ncbi:hypothetical protein FEM48_Zijuj09G0205100 [Ziziphus jujuba var. spinosa]|uniref:Uncharacterized protein n=1 Tax=Ziziphus jujuba var. spinosa TaxID=714518 RepID=A0A978UV58_ZIZJJ|nr:hypothetical protein FEM48_Zijuj09G0205100 [Ziziphus jujuba var. spinosa]
MMGLLLLVKFECLGERRKFSPFVVCHFEVVVILGQGYLWMVHKTPGRHIWDLAIRNDRLGMMLAERLREQGLDPLQHLGWNNNKGSILIGRRHGELDALKGRVTLLRHAGLRAEYLSGGELLLKEPDLLVDEDSVAAFVNRHFSSEGRYVEFFYDQVTSLLRLVVILFGCARSCNDWPNIKMEIVLSRASPENHLCCQSGKLHRIELLHFYDPVRIRYLHVLDGLDLSVAVVDKAVPCSGRSLEELDVLKRRVTLLRDAGLRAEYLSGGDLLLKETDLLIDEDSGAALLRFMCRLTGIFASEDRYVEFFYDPVTSLLRYHSSEEVIAVKASKNTLYSKKAIVVAADCWSRSLMHDLFRESEIVLDAPEKPQKGHQLVLENFDSLKVNHGQMEAGYVNH